MGRAALLVAALGLGACGDRAPSGPMRTVSDAIGTRVSVPAEVRRIVATVPGLVEIVIALGARDRLVGVSAAGRLPPDVDGVARIATYPTISSEQMAELRPDLVLVDPTLSPRDLLPLRERFAVFAADSRSLDGLRATIATLGEALGRGADAGRLVAELDAARAAVRGRARGARVLAVSGGDSLHALGPGSLLHDLLLAVGAKNVAASIDRPSAAVSDERVREWSPAWLLVVGGGSPADLAARLPKVPAVAQGRVVDATVDDLVRAGPRTARALRRLADVLAGDRPPAALVQEGT